MPQPSNVGGSLMSYPTSVDTGQVAPWIFTDDSVFAGFSAVLAANVVFLYAFETPVSLSVSSVRFRPTATATGTTDCGIYDANGNKLISTGAIANVANITMSNSFSGGNYALSPGRYYLALTCSNSTDTYLQNAPGASTATISRYRQGATAASAGVLPASLGALSGPSSCPAMSLQVVGGLG